MHLIGWSWTCECLNEWKWQHFVNCPVPVGPLKGPKIRAGGRGVCWIWFRGLTIINLCNQVIPERSGASVNMQTPFPSVGKASLANFLKPLSKSETAESVYLSNTAGSSWSLLVLSFSICETWRDVLLGSSLLVCYCGGSLVRREQYTYSCEPIWHNSPAGAGEYHFCTASAFCMLNMYPSASIKLPKYCILLMKKINLSPSRYKFCSSHFAKNTSKRSRNCSFSLPSTVESSSQANLLFDISLKRGTN